MGICSSSCIPRKKEDASSVFEPSPSPKPPVGPSACDHNDNDKERKDADKNKENKSSFVFSDIACKLNLRDVYEVGDDIGSGEFGTVYECTERRTGTRFACKTIFKQLALKKAPDLMHIRREVDVMRHLTGSTCVIAAHDIFEDANHVHIILDLCEGGNLFDSIGKVGHYSEHVAALFVRDILQAVAYCHSMGVVHRDVKPENFLLAQPQGHGGLKLADFGLATFFVEGQMMKKVAGSPVYIAPEVIRRAYRKEADVWSAGVVAYELLSGLPPFWGDTEAEVFRAILNDAPDLDCDAWTCISAEAKDFVGRMLQKDPAQRASIAELMEHPWLMKHLADDPEALSVPVLSGVVDRIRKFPSMNRLRREAHRLLASFMSPQALLGLHVLFLEMDTDNDGRITPSDLYNWLKLKGTHLPEQETQVLFNMADTKADGCIDLEEFLACTLRMHKFDSDELFEKAFKEFDVDEDGYITVPDMRKAFGARATTCDIEDVINSSDTDNDGKINYTEFKQLLTNSSFTTEVSALHKLTRNESYMTRPSQLPPLQESTPPLLPDALGTSDATRQ